MEKDERKKLVSELQTLIEKGNAHVTLWNAMADLPAELRGVTPENLPYSIWQLVEHLRITQKDILDFSASDDYQEIEWPKDYWTEPLEVVSDEQWNTALEQIRQDQQTFIQLLKDDTRDLFATFPWGTGQNLLREAMLIADHNSYHTAEIVVLRRIMNAWH
ncbi:DinB family protein [Dyadobacter sp. Leaf189]|uniref:DinB family protein n=1 Tax=Dyadobacter sp. Leaf189 TaxID=1736295 RepID=UPI0006FDFA0D|nr:DinB family protein [Dyadobacter sp. Leaf189]KQS26845.1 ABC transporter [Dyadobacter sp. Leaf189]